MDETNVATRDDRTHVPPDGSAAVPAARARVPGPVVLAVRPREGWRRAGALQRVGAGSAPVVLLLWVLALLLFGATSAYPLVALGFLVVWSLGGPPAFFAAARVLRPYPPGGGGLERTTRHAAAALATSYAALLFAALTLFGSEVQGPIPVQDLTWFYVTIPSFLGIVTLAWGCVAAVVRASRRVAQVTAPRAPRS